MEKEFINIYFDKKRFLASCKMVYRHQLFKDKSIVGGFRVLLVIGGISLGLVLYLTKGILYYIGIVGLVLFIGVLLLIIIGNIRTLNEFRQSYSKVVKGFDLDMRFLFDQEFFELYSFNDVNNTFGEKWHNVNDAILIERTSTLILNLNNGNRVFIIPSIEEYEKLKTLVMFMDQKNISVLEMD